MTTKQSHQRSSRSQVTRGLVLRYQTWFVRVQVPPDVAGIVGRKVLIRTTGHTDLIQAIPIGRAIHAEFKQQIDHARRGPTRPLHSLSTRGLSATARRALTASQRPLTAYTAMLDDWYASLGAMKHRQRDQYRSDVILFGAARLLIDVTQEAAQQWVVTLGRTGESPKTTARRLSSLRGYWRHMQDAKAVPAGEGPFMGLRLAKAGVRVPRRQPFTPEQLGNLWGASKADRPLADLIALAAYTGARIEELCSLTVAGVDLQAGTMHVSSKTDAGDRVVPIHSAIGGLVGRLVGAAQSGRWLVHSTATNKYGERSVPLGKRFGRLKALAGHGPLLVFHSIRKTLSTRLKDAGCPEPIAADIIGHELETMTYGLYAGTSDLSTRKRWLDAVGVIGGIAPG